MNAWSNVVEIQTRVATIQHDEDFASSDVWIMVARQLELNLLLVKINFPSTSDSQITTDDFLYIISRLLTYQCYYGVTLSTCGWEVAFQFIWLVRTIVLIIPIHWWLPSQAMATGLWMRLYDLLFLLKVTTYCCFNIVFWEWIIYRKLVTLFPSPAQLSITCRKARGAWYLFSREHDVIAKICQTNRLHFAYFNWLHTVRQPPPTS